MNWGYSIFSRTGPAALLVLVIGPPAHAVDCDAPVVLGDRPRMEDYAQSRDFLAAAMDYKQQEALLEKQLHECPQLSGGPDPESSTNDKPEDLDEAVKRGRNLPEFDYDRHSRWYNRTTSRSFGLPPLPPARMDDRLIQAPIRAANEQPIPPEVRSAFVALHGPLDDVVDGRETEDLYLRRFRDNLLSDEQAVAEAAVPRPYTHMVQYRNPAGTWLTFFYFFDELVYTTGFVAACLSDQC